MVIDNIRPLPSSVRGGECALVRVTYSDGKEQHFVASYIPAAFDTGKPETLVFESDSEGTVSSWEGVAGGMHMSIPEAIEDLRQILAEEKTRTIMDSPVMVNAGGDPLSAMLNTFMSMGTMPSDYYADEED